MVDWKALGMSFLRAEGQFFTDVAELVIDRKLNRQNWMQLLGERMEAAQHTMLNDWRAAGVTYPMTMYGTVAETGMAVWMLALMTMPGRTLRWTGMMYLLGGLYGASQVMAKRSGTAAPRPVGEMQTPGTQPLRPFEEQQGGPYRSAGW